MNPDLSKKAVNKIESLCQLGCTQVNELLEKAEKGHDIEELSGFSKTEISMIIDELIEIMSVYEDEK
ncbi:MAG: hypothetical protein KJN89_01580 [Gammaproteobacteria bacterium]|nr:hypothetical protein [Gammaproteobacteria bacterium]NNJ49035.1 hypothetical protein [Gammaproteobacteria bacterium]